MRNGDPWETENLDELRAVQRRWLAVVPDVWWSDSKRALSHHEARLDREAPWAPGSELALRQAAEEEGAELEDFFEACEAAWRDDAVSAAVRRHVAVLPNSDDSFEGERTRSGAAPEPPARLEETLFRTGVFLLLADRAALGAERQPEPGD
ncbi:MAG: hypothetical protein ACHQNA_06260 [Acidimicrobiales bacterium]